MPIQNKTMLITYSDSLGNNLKDLYENLEKYFGDAVGGVHLLPFFPSTGDRGFAPVDYDQVDPAFGDWEDVKRLGDKYYLMFDFMIIIFLVNLSIIKTTKKSTTKVPTRIFSSTGTSSGRRIVLLKRMWT